MAKSGQFAAIKPLIERWQGWSTRFAALQPREKYLVIGATLVGIVFGGYSLWIEPARLQTARLSKSIAQQQGEITQLQAQVAVLVQGQQVDPDAANRALLAQLQAAIQVADHDIRSFDSVLVSPRQAPALLQTLLTRHRGLSLLSLTTLPPQPLLAPPEKKAGTPTAAAGKDAPPATPPPATEAPAGPGSNIFKHGIEIRIAGGYHDLLAYVAEIENGPQKLLWGGMKLSSPTDKYPVGELTLTVYSLSLESIWLAV